MSNQGEFQTLALNAGTAVCLLAMKESTGPMQLPVCHPRTMIGVCLGIKRTLQMAKPRGRKKLGSFPH